MSRFVVVGPQTYLSYVAPLVFDLRIGVLQLGVGDACAPAIQVVVKKRSLSNASPRCNM
jgi:hypothetical protein